MTLNEIAAAAIDDGADIRYVTEMPIKFHTMSRHNLVVLAVYVVGGSIHIDVGDEEER